MINYFIQKIGSRTQDGGEEVCLHELSATLFAGKCCKAPSGHAYTFANNKNTDKLVEV